MTRLLEHFGGRVSFTEAQTRCGQPFFDNDFHPKLTALAEKTSTCSRIVRPPPRPAAAAA